GAGAGPGRRQVLADRRREVPGVAPARAGAAEVALDHGDVDAGLAQRQRRAEAREAAADDRDVGAQRTGERRLGRRRRRVPEAPPQPARARLPLEGTPRTWAPPRAAPERRAAA